MEEAAFSPSLLGPHTVTQLFWVSVSPCTGTLYWSRVFEARLHAVVPLWSEVVVSVYMEAAETMKALQFHHQTRSWHCFFVVAKLDAAGTWPL